MNKIILLILLGFTFTYSQSVKVLENELLTEGISGQYFHPHFNADDTEIYITKVNYKGLFALSLKDKKLKTLTNENGAGYKPLILNDGETILYRPFTIKNGLKYNLLKSIDTKNIKINVIEPEQRNLSVPAQINARKLIYLRNRNVKEIVSPSKILAKTQRENKAVFVKDNSLYIIKDNETIELSPLGKGVYVWESLSADGKRIVFTFGNKGTFVCDLEGNILLNIKEAHYPKFSPNGKYISYMIDKDNGYNYTASELFIYSIDEKKAYQLTNTQNKIEMFADWSNTGNKLVYQTDKGEIYLMKLDIKN